jgi:hypothetical protein
LIPNDLPKFTDDGERLDYLMKIIRQETKYSLYKARQAKAAKDPTEYHYWRGVYSTACSVSDLMDVIHTPVQRATSTEQRLRTIVQYAVSFGKELVIGTVSDFLRGGR